MAFFKVALALLVTFGKELKAPAELSQFLATFNLCAAKFTDIEGFRKRVRDMFLDELLLNACRGIMLSSKQQQMLETPNRKHSMDDCAAENPYCSWLRNHFRKENNDVIFRVDSLTENLKFNYFDPFNFRFNSAFSEELSVKYQGICRERLIRNFFQKRNQAIDGSLGRSLTFGAKTEGRGDPRRYRRGDRRFWSQLEINVKKSENEQNERLLEDDLMILRSNHICKHEREDYVRKKRIEQFKCEYFYVTYRILFKFLGRSLKCYIFQETKQEPVIGPDGVARLPIGPFKPLGVIKKPVNCWKHREVFLSKFAHEDDRSKSSEQKTEEEKSSRKQRRRAELTKSMIAEESLKRNLELLQTMFTGEFQKE